MKIIQRKYPQNVYSISLFLMTWKKKRHSLYILQIGMMLL